MKKIHLHGPLYHLRNRQMILNWTSTKYDTSTKHFVKSVRIRGFSGPHFPAFGLTTEIYRASLRIQSKYRKIQTRKTLGRHFLQSVIQMWHAQLGRLSNRIITFKKSASWKIGSKFNYNIISFRLFWMNLKHSWPTPEWGSLFGIHRQCSTVTLFKVNQFGMTLADETENILFTKKVVQNTTPNIKRQPPKVCCKKGVHKNFAIFIGKQNN